MVRARSIYPCLGVKYISRLCLTFIFSCPDVGLEEGEEEEEAEDEGEGGEEEETAEDVREQAEQQQQDDIVLIDTDDEVNDPLTCDLIFLCLAVGVRDRIGGGRQGPVYSPLSSTSSSNEALPSSKRSVFYELMIL